MASKIPLANLLRQISLFLSTVKDKFMPSIRVGKDISEILGGKMQKYELIKQKRHCIIAEISTVHKMDNKAF